MCLIVDCPNRAHTNRIAFLRTIAKIYLQMFHKKISMDFSQYMRCGSEGEFYCIIQYAIGIRKKIGRRSMLGLIFNLIRIRNDKRS